MIVSFLFHKFCSITHRRVVPQLLALLEHLRRLHFHIALRPPRRCGLLAHTAARGDGDGRAAAAALGRGRLDLLDRSVPEHHFIGGVPPRPSIDSHHQRFLSFRIFIFETKGMSFKSDMIIRFHFFFLVVNIMLSFNKHFLKLSNCFFFHWTRRSSVSYIL